MKDLTELNDLIEKVTALAWTLECVGEGIKELEIVETMDSATSVLLLARQLYETTSRIEEIVSDLRAEKPVEEEAGQ